MPFVARRGAVKIPITCLRWQDWTENGLRAGDHQFEKKARRPSTDCSSSLLEANSSGYTSCSYHKAAKTYSGCYTWKPPHPFCCYLRKETVPRDIGTLKEPHFGGNLQNPHPSFRLTPSCTRLLPLLKDCFTARKEQRKDYNNNLHGTLLGMGFFGR